MLTEQTTTCGVDRRTLVAAGAIVVATILVYLPAIGGGFIWDDPDYVINNRTLRSLKGLAEIWTNPRSLPQWYPMVHTTFWVEYHLWQLNPLGYHVVNVLLHIGAALLLWRLLATIQVPGAALAAAIFAFHPVHVESVAWITERKNVLSGVFYFASFIACLRFLGIAHSSNQPGERSTRWWYGVALFLFVLALLSKTVTATLPAAVLVVLWWKRGAIRARDALQLVPFFSLGITFGLITAYLEATHVGASGEQFAELNFTPFERILIAGNAVLFYAWKLVFPWPLVFIYPRWELDVRQWSQWIAPAAVLGVLVSLLVFRNRLGRAPLAAGLLFVGTLFPALGFVNIFPMRYSFVADHFQYLASAALIAPIAYLLCRYVGKASLVALVPLLAITAARTPVYKDVETLWRDTLKRNPGSWMAHVNLGHALMARAERGDTAALREAESHYLKALELASNYETHSNAGMVHGAMGNDEAALREFDKALELNPGFAIPYYGKGMVYQRQGRIDDAIEAYEEAIKRYPHYPKANYRLGMVLERQNRLPEAAERYRVAVGANPDDFEARYSLGSVLVRLGQYDEAIYNLREAIRIRPGEQQTHILLRVAERARAMGVNPLSGQ